MFQSRRHRRRARGGGSGNNNLRRETRAPDTRLPASLRATLGLSSGGGSGNRREFVGGSSGNRRGFGGGSSTDRSNDDSLKRSRKRVRSSNSDREKSRPSQSSEKSEIPYVEVDPDEKEVRRLEKLLGIGKKRRRAKEKGAKFSYLSIFGGEEKELAELADMCTKGGAVGADSESNDEEAPDPADNLDVEDELTDELEVVEEEDILSEDPANELAEESGDDADENLIGGSDELVGSAVRKLERNTEKSGVVFDMNANENNNDDGDGPPRKKRALMTKDSQKSAAHYVPPSRRDGQSGDTQRIGRRIRGLLNRLANTNAGGIASTLETLMRSPGAGVSRSAVIKIYVDGALDAVRDGSAVGGLSPFVAPHAAIVGHLSAVLDMRVLAEVLVGTVRRIEDALPLLSKGDGEESILVGETPRRPIFGYVAFVGALYQRSAICSSVVHELIRNVANGGEKERVELLLVLFRQIGAHLRKEDPISLKDMISFLRERFESERQHKLNGAKISVMLDLISAVKNNKLRKGELMEQETQFNWAAKVITPVTATFSELSNDAFTDTRWWEGEAIQNANQMASKIATKDKTEGIANSFEAEDADAVDLSALAASLRLNTDFRRALFGAIMSAVSVTDAFERVERLGGLTSSKGRNGDCSRVVLHCCAAERGYNPFYALLAERLCKHSRSMRFSFEHAVCDIFRVVQGGARKVSKRRIGNYGQFVAELLAGKSLTIAIFKNTAELCECSGMERELYIQIFSRLARCLRRQVDAKTLSASDLTKALFGKLSSAERDVAGMTSRFLVTVVANETAPLNMEVVSASASVLARAGRSKEYSEQDLLDDEDAI